MEPVTHFLTGACIGRAGLNRKTAYATLAATLAAEAADIDILWGLRGPVEELKHHRGITHTFIGAPVMAAAVVGVIAAWHFWGRKIFFKKVKAPTPSLRWSWLYATALIAALSHILLDWMNNYGVRPFFPFNPRWYAGSIVFIAEPVIWALFLLAFVVPWVFGLADGEIGVRRNPFRGRGWAIFALSGMAALWCWRWAEQGRARMLLERAQAVSAPMCRVAMEPYPVNPWRWHAIVETDGYYQFAEINTWSGAVESDPADALYKPDVTPAVQAAKATGLGQVYLDWGAWAVVRDVGQETIPGIDPPELPKGRTWTTVEFNDLRFSYGFTGGDNADVRGGLSGWAYIVDGREEAAEGMGRREQKTEQ